MYRRNRGYGGVHLALIIVVLLLMSLLLIVTMMPDCAASGGHLVKVGLNSWSCQR